MGAYELSCSGGGEPKSGIKPRSGGSKVWGHDGLMFILFLGEKCNANSWDIWLKLSSCAKVV